MKIGGLTQMLQNRAIIDKLKMDGRRAKESPECVYNDEATQK